MNVKKKNKKIQRKNKTKKDKQTNSNKNKNTFLIMEELLICYSYYETMYDCYYGRY